MYLGLNRKAWWAVIVLGLSFGWTWRQSHPPVDAVNETAIKIQAMETRLNDHIKYIDELYDKQDEVEKKIDDLENKKKEKSADTMSDDINLDLSDDDHAASNADPIRCVWNGLQLRSESLSGSLSINSM